METPLPALLLAASTTLAAPAVLALQPHVADYEFSIGNKFSGTATRVLTTSAPNQWTYRFTARIPLVASATETSNFFLKNHQVQSVRHQMAFRIMGVSRNSDVQFVGRQATVNRNGKTSRYPTHEGTLDMLNMEIQLREDLKNGGLRSRYWLSDDKGENPVQFVLRGKATITTPAGRFETVRVDRLHSDPERSTSFWLAPQLDYLPVQVTQKDDNMTYNILLKAHRPQ